MRESKKKLSNKLNRLLEIPKEVGGIYPKITIVGFDEMLIENYKGISEYEDFYMKINTEMGIININGFNLELEQITEEDALVRGKIESIDIERLE
ncbi:MAG: YabP/YqfC family sporulation protein [Oscillospiraceae bacterium]|nr:YabP/YqfC family sporulation protein [Oscillospiraceae bacterium]